MTSVTTQRFYEKRVCDKVEALLGYRITDAVIVKEKGKPVKVLSVTISKKNQN